MAATLQAIDCQSAAATALAFGRLFGRDGGLTAALTALLTLYVGLLAIGLLTGRSRLGLATLSPRMMVLGLILTFATSWVAYQNVIWSLLTGGPDQIGAIVLGIKGSASQAFARRLDLVFAAVAAAADQSREGAGPTGGTSPADLLSYAGLLLLLGTVGVLVTARIALAALLAVGPVFIVLALFTATRGLFEGWLKVTVMLALVPLFAVLLGAGTVAAITPMLAGLGDGGADLREATTVLVAAVVHCALMGLSLRLVLALVQSWRPAPAGGDPVGAGAGRAFGPAPAGLAVLSAAGGDASRPGGAPKDERVRAIVAASAGLAALPPPPATASSQAPGGWLAQPPPPPGAVSRAHAIARAIPGPAATTPAPLR